MENDQNEGGQVADKVVSDIGKDFKIVGSHRVHSWYAWAIIGIVFGMALGIIYVANRSAQFDASKAANSPTTSTYGALVPIEASVKGTGTTVVPGKFFGVVMYKNNPTVFIGEDVSGKELITAPATRTVTPPATGPNGTYITSYITLANSVATVGYVSQDNTKMWIAMPGTKIIDTSLAPTYDLTKRYTQKVEIYTYNQRQKLEVPVTVESLSVFPAVGTAGASKILSPLDPSFSFSGGLPVAAGRTVFTNVSAILPAVAANGTHKVVLQSSGPTYSFIPASGATTIKTVPVKLTAAYRKANGDVLPDKIAIQGNFDVYGSDPGAKQIQVTANTAMTLAIGKTFGGGIIFTVPVPGTNGTRSLRSAIALPAVTGAGTYQFVIGPKDYDKVPGGYKIYRIKFMADATGQATEITIPDAELTDDDAAAAPTTTPTPTPTASSDPYPYATSPSSGISVTSFGNGNVIIGYNSEGFVTAAQRVVGRVNITVSGTGLATTAPITVSLNNVSVGGAFGESANPQTCVPTLNAAGTIGTCLVTFAPNFAIPKNNSVVVGVRVSGATAPYRISIERGQDVQFIGDYGAGSIPALHILGENLPLTILNVK